MSKPTPPTPPTERALRYVTANEYVIAAGLSYTGRTLRRWCEENRHLANALGEILAKGKYLYDSNTAPNFRKLWIEAERRYRDETTRLARDADRRLEHDEGAK